MILGIQIFGLLFGIFMIYLTFVSGKRKEFNTGEILFWIAVWTAFILAVMFPTPLIFFVKEGIGLTRLLDFFIIIGFMFLIGFIFYTYTLIRRNQKKLEKVVRQIATEKK